MSYKSLDDILIDIAKLTIENNWYRNNSRLGGYHYFDQSELDTMNSQLGCCDKNKFDGGYCFLDKNNGDEGMIRLYCGYANPKWSFWVEDGEIKVDLA